MESRLRISPLANWLALLAVIVVPGWVTAAQTALHFTGSAIDGPFQLYDALRRIAAGQRAGVDFQFFHGVGVPYAHYWLYRGLGGRFQDAEMARELIAAVVFPASLLVFFRAFSSSWTRAACLTTAAIGTLYLLRMPALMFALNSMVGVRSALPALIPIVLYRAETRPARVLGTGAMLGLSLFLSTEQGLAAVGAFVAISALIVVRRPAKLRALADALATIAVAAAMLILMLFRVGGWRGAMGALRYNFKLVPMDQYWFFGVPPNPFISSWGAGARMLVGAPAIGLALVLGVAAAIVYSRRFWREPDPVSGRREIALTFLAIYGVTSCASLLGVFIPAYAQTCWRAVISLAALEMLAWGERREPVAVAPGHVPGAVSTVVLAIVVLALLTNRSFRSALLGSVPRFVAEHVVAHRGFEIAGIWPQTLAADDQIVRGLRSPQGAPPKIWSTYAGWLEARAGVFHPSFDYVIHPLGPENRKAYLETFRAVRPDLVQTVRPAYSQYELWIENATWDVYRDLLESYTIAGETPWSFFWTRRADSGASLRLVAAGNPGMGVSDIPLPPVPADGGSPVTLLEVELQYTVHNPLRWLPVFGSMPRYLVLVEGALTPMPVSLDPYVTAARFPVFAKQGQTPVLHIRPFSLLPGVGITVGGIRVSVVPIDARNAPWLREIGSRYGF